MRRFREIVGAARERYPGDGFFRGFEESCRRIPKKKSAYLIYERALSSLDQRSFLVLKRKAVAHFQDHRKGQLKQGFFNQLNEAFAYRALVRWGYSVELLEEGSTAIPDLRFSSRAARGYCEVKTISITDAEIERRRSGAVFDGSDYGQLSASFLRKMRTRIGQAVSQLGDNPGLVYLLVHFDDMSNDNLNVYRRQLVKFVRDEPTKDLHLKLWRQGRWSISKGPIARRQYWKNS